MKPITIYIDKIGCFLTGNTAIHLKNMAYRQWLELYIKRQKHIAFTAADINRPVNKAKQPLTDLDIALMQEKKRYYRYTVVEKRRAI